MTIKWYEELYANSKYFCQLIDEESGNAKVLPMMMNIVKPGLISNNQGRN
jgi:hypothetical protein